MKKVMQISLMVILIAGTAILVSFTDLEYRHRSYSSFNIVVVNPSDKALITKDEIEEIIDGHFGKITGSPLSRINLFELENTIEANPYVSHCEVFQTIGGGLTLIARVREPLVRIINLDNQQFYLDRAGCAIPVNPAHPSHVIVANGMIGDRFISLDKSERSLKSFTDTSMLRHIYPVALEIAGDEFLSSFIDQIYLNDHKEIELVPKIGTQTILFGNSDNAEEKLENLKAFYTKVMSRMDWKIYDTISLKYNNQVVCTKNNQYEQE